MYGQVVKKMLVIGALGVVKKGMEKYTCEIPETSRCPKSVSSSELLIS